MTIEEALAPLLREANQEAQNKTLYKKMEGTKSLEERYNRAFAELLAPHIETFGRACYYAGIDETERPNSDRGIEAGVKAVMEEL